MSNGVRSEAAPRKRPIVPEAGELKSPVALLIGWMLIPLGFVLMVEGLGITTRLAQWVEGMW